MPAFLHSRCRRLVSCCADASSRKRISWLSSDTSARWAVTRAPCGTPSASHSATVSAMLRAETSHMATLQPSAMSWRASSRPIPVPPPVTTAILPAKSFMLVPLDVTAPVRPQARRSLAPRPTGVHRDAAEQPADRGGSSSSDDRSPAMAQKRGGRKWSAKVTETSDALDLEPKVFEERDPGKIAASLKRSAEHSHRRKGTPFQSAMSMLPFYITGAAKGLQPSRKRPLDKPKTDR